MKNRGRYPTFAGQLCIWKSVEAIAKVLTPAGRPRYPRIHGLWQQVQSSGHTIYIEMPKNGVENVAGLFLVEKEDSTAMNHTLAIHLYLPAIDGADTGKWARRANGFIPFARLRGCERYAEVLGHELAHAALFLQDPDYARLMQDQDNATAEMIALRKRHTKKAITDPAFSQCLGRMESLERQVEGPAIAAEIEVWQELAQGRQAPAR